MLTLHHFNHQEQCSTFAQSKLSLFCIVILLAMFSLPDYVYSSTPTRTYDGAFTLTLENDVFTNSDNYYTNGTALAWTSNELGVYDDSELPARLGKFWSFLPYIEDDGYENYAVWTIGQQMHTPDDITDSDPPLNDQPYAGVAYLDSALYARRGRWGHVYSFRLGVVGPLSFADKTQIMVHELVDTDKPKGWDTQLPNEILLNFDFTTRYVLGDIHFGQSVQ